MWDYPWWSVPLVSSTTPCVNGKLPFCWKATVDPIGKEIETFLGIIVLSLFILGMFKGLMVLITALKLIGSLFVFGNRVLIVLLNRSVAVLGGPVPIDIDLIGNKARIMSSLLSRHFLMVHFMNILHASTSPLHWWWCDEVMACSVQLPERLSKFVWYEICAFIWYYFLGSPNYANTILTTLTRLTAERLFVFFTAWKLL